MKILKSNEQELNNLIGKNAKKVLEIIDQNKPKKNKGDSNDKRN